MAIAALESFDDDFSPATGRKIEKELIEDGSHQVEIRSAVLDKTTSTQEDILRLHLELLAGSQQGNYFEHVYFFRSKEAIEAMGADLRTIGFDSHLWKKSTGRPLSKELPLAVRRMKGMRLNIGKSTRKDNRTGKTYNNIFIKSAVDGYGPRQLSEVGSGPDSSDSSDGDTPF